MQSRQHLAAVADATIDEGHVVNRIERRLKRITRQRSDLGFDRKLADTFDQPLADLPVGDQIGNEDPRQLMARGETAISGPRITVPSSFISSANTPTGDTPASRQRSTQASVWPERISTPPSLATSGNT